jgi:hypothetical protein
MQRAAATATAVAGAGGDCIGGGTVQRSQLLHLVNVEALLLALKAASALRQQLLLFFFRCGSMGSSRLRCLRCLKHMEKGTVRVVETPPHGIAKHGVCGLDADEWVR